ncbi:MAG: N-carbamoylputrescine amidase [Arenicella sp.]|jgi:N-carbamoylputrescine amidase
MSNSLTFILVTKLIMVTLVCYCLLAPARALNDASKLTIAMLHLELRYADLAHNAALIKRGITLAAEHNADWVMTPELSHTGYRFDLKLGTDWITQGPDKYVQNVQSLAKEHRMVIFLSHLEGNDSEQMGRQLFNTIFVIDKSGEIIGRHQKINTIPISERWSTAGIEPTVVDVDGHKVGLLICADAWPATHAQTLKNQGAELILSSASWAPGKYGPGDTWERRSDETGLPLFISNRTGIEREFDLTAAVSAVAHHGKRIVSHQSANSKLVVIKWDTQKSVLLDSYSIDIP